MIIRPATLADLPAIAAVHIENWQWDYAGVLPRAGLAERLATYMSGKWQPDALARGKVLMVPRGAGVAGFVAFDPDHADGVFIDNLHVGRTERGKGVGKALMVAVAKAASGRRIVLEVLADNTATRAIYAAWGGVEGPAFEDEILGAPVVSHLVKWADPVALAQGLSSGAGS